MSTLGHACPSGRIGSSDLVQRIASGRSQNVALSCSLGALLEPLTPRRPVRDTSLTSLPAIYARRYSNGFYRVVHSGRFTSAALLKQLSSGRSQRVATSSFFGTLLPPSFGLTVDRAPLNGIGTILVNPGTITPPVGATPVILVPPIATILLDPEADGFAPFTLAVLRPQSFMPSTGGNVGYSF